MTSNLVDLPVSPYLTEAQAAARLGFSPKTLRNWRARSAGPSYLRLGSSVRYHMTTLDHWAMAQEVA